MDKPKSSSDHLMEAFNFTPEDLAVNGEGELSIVQWHRLKVRGIPSFTVLGMGLFGIAISLLLKDEGIAFIAIFASILSTLYCLYYGRALYRNEVYSVCGKIKKFEKVGRPSIPERRSIFVHDQFFTISVKQFEVLQEENHYCAYYVPGSERILSIQLVALSKEDLFEEV